MAYKIILKRPNDTKSSLLVQINKTGIPDKFYSGKSIQTKNWDYEERLVTKGEDNYKLINNYLEDWERELRRIIEERESKKLPWNPPAIKLELSTLFNRAKIKQPTSIAETEFDFLKFCDENIEDAKKRGSKMVADLRRNKKLFIISQGLISKSEQTHYENLFGGNRSKYDFGKLKPIPASKVNQKLVDNFTSYMKIGVYPKKIKGKKELVSYKKNYQAKQLKILRQIIQKAIKNKKVEFFPVEDNKSNFEHIDHIYTDFAQIQAFADLEFEQTISGKPSDEEVVRDFYVINCFLGMRFSDLSKISEHMFDKNRIINKKQHVIFKGRQQKTKNLVEFPVHQNAVNKLEKYNYRMPKMSISKFNALLKVVAFKAGLTSLFRKIETRGNQGAIILDIQMCDLISSHTARRSFCTNYYNAGWPIQAIMAVSGHKTEAEFLRYIKGSMKVEDIAAHLSKIPTLSLKSNNQLTSNAA